MTRSLEFPLNTDLKVIIPLEFTPFTMEIQDDDEDHCASACELSGNTLVLTNNGYVKLRTLSNKQAYLYDGCMFRNVYVKKVEDQHEIMADLVITNITTSTGKQIQCSKDHMVPLYFDGELTFTSAKETRKHDLIISKLALPLVSPENPSTIPGDAYTHGFYQAQAALGDPSTLEKASLKKADYQDTEDQNTKNHQTGGQGQHTKNQEQQTGGQGQRTGGHGQHTRSQEQHTRSQRQDQASEYNYNNVIFIGNRKVDRIAPFIDNAQSQETPTPSIHEFCKRNGSTPIWIDKSVYNESTLNYGKAMYMAPIPSVKDRLSYLSGYIDANCRITRDKNQVFFLHSRFSHVRYDTTLLLRIFETLGVTAKANKDQSISLPFSLIRKLYFMGFNPKTHSFYLPANVIPRKLDFTPIYIAKIDESWWVDGFYSIYTTDKSTLPFFIIADGVATGRISAE